jgi:hypothetical protein
MAEIISLDGRRQPTASGDAASAPAMHGAEPDAGARRAALYDMLRILGRTVRTCEMGAEEKAEFALAALKVLGPGWVISRSC